MYRLNRNQKAKISTRAYEIQLLLPSATFDQTDMSYLFEIETVITSLLSDK